MKRAYQTGFPNLGNGQPATLFSSYDASTVDTHVHWMQENGIDTLAVQRFGDFLDVRDTVTEHVRDAAEAHGRKFYIMYDISGWTTFQTDLKTDWQNRVITKMHLTDSPAYAVQDGKPVVCIWGLGYLDRPGDGTTSLDVVNFTSRIKGVYVIGGVGPKDWRTPDGKGWSKPDFGSVYDALNAISPWMIGVIGDGQWRLLTISANNATRATKSRTATPTASTINRASCPATSKNINASTVTSCGTSSRT